MTTPTRSQIAAMQAEQAKTKASNNQPGDLLDMDWINSLPQPFFARRYGAGDEWWWPVNDFEVETGLFRIDVVGKLEAWHISDAARIRDGLGREYRCDAFYSDAIPEEREPTNRPSPALVGENPGDTQ